MAQSTTVVPASSRVSPEAAFAEGVPLLWTGGWDSTFQLLRLLLQYRQPVTPYYLRDPTRRSSEIELRTMQRLREAIVRRDPSTAALLQPVHVHEVTQLAPDAGIAQAFAETARAWFIGSQYEWLARFCAQQGITGLELCVHRDDRAHGVVAPLATAESSRGYANWKLDPQRTPPAVQRVFGAFTFPLLELTKREMAAEAQARGWTALMGMTWFCHAPRGDEPCGRCAPCLYTIEEGLGWRIPWRRRMASLLYRRLVWPLRLPARALRDRLRRRAA